MDTGFDFADVCDEVVSRAGGETATAADIQKIRRGMRILAERWTAQGYNTWRVSTFTTQASGVDPKLVLPKCVDDVIVANSIRGGTGSEMPMHRIPPSEYMQLTAKHTGGRPSQYWLQRTEPPVLHIFPIGSTTTPDTIVVNYVERPEKYEVYTDDPDDVPGRWLEAYICGLSHDLARKRPPFDEALISRLKGEAAEAEELAQRADRNRVNYRMRISI